MGEAITQLDGLVPHASHRAKSHQNGMKDAPQKRGRHPIPDQSEKYFQEKTDRSGSRC